MEDLVYVSVPYRTSEYNGTPYIHGRPPPPPRVTGVTRGWSIERSGVGIYREYILGEKIIPCVCDTVFLRRLSVEAVAIVDVGVMPSGSRVAAVNTQREFPYRRQ